MKRAIVTYAIGAHEELLDVAIPTYREFAARHGYDLLTTRGDLVESIRYWSQITPAAWNKIALLLDAFDRGYDELVMLDCDLVIVDPSEDFPRISGSRLFSLVRHFENQSEVPNTGVWRLTRPCQELLYSIMTLEVFRNHGWWEQAALMTLMGYTVPPEGSVFKDTKCRNVVKTKWFNACQFMRISWNSHPQYRAEKPKIVHCSYPCMTQRLEVMRALVKDPCFNYPRYEKKLNDS